MREGASEYFLECYGSFSQHGWGYIFLEYAEQGSLANFFSKFDVAHDELPLQDLWASMINLINGFVLLHHLDGNTTSGVLRGVHQDLRPSNIFVFRAQFGTDDEHGSGKYVFKIGDFGLSSFGPSKAVHPYNEGSTMYRAPELSVAKDILQSPGLDLSPKADIWSLGCIFLEMMVWAINGERGRDEFCSQRVVDGSPEASFYNGTGRVTAAEKIMRLLSRRKNFNNRAHAAAFLFRRIQVSMLNVNPLERKDAADLSGELSDLHKRLTQPSFGIWTLKCNY